MLYNNSNPYDRARFLAKAHELADKGEVTELTCKTARTLNQNSYLHLLLAILADYVGTTEEDVKVTYYKRLINPDLFVRRITDKIYGADREYLRSTRKLSKAEMSQSIDRLKMWAIENKIYLPEPDNKEELLYAQVEISKKLY